MIGIDLSGRRALVTGANSGLGRAIALNLAAAGARVAVHALNDHEAAEAVVKQIQQAGSSAMAVYGDISQTAQVEKIFADVDAAFGGLDILVNNAGLDGTCALAPSGLSILILDRGDYLPREPANWDAETVFNTHRYHTDEQWQRLVAAA